MRVHGYDMHSPLYSRGFALRFFFLFLFPFLSLSFLFNINVFHVVSSVPKIQILIL